MSKIKELIDSVEIYKLVFEILTSTKNKYEELSLVLSEFKKDIDRLHVKLTELENIKHELNGFKVKQEESFETMRKEIGRKLETLNKQILEFTVNTKPSSGKVTKQKEENQNRIKKLSKDNNK
jgi:hypothetical protein